MSFACAHDCSLNGRRPLLWHPDTIAHVPPGHTLSALAGDAECHAPNRRGLRWSGVPASAARACLRAACRAACCIQLRCTYVVSQPFGKAFGSQSVRRWTMTSSLQPISSSLERPASAPAAPVQRWPLSILLANPNPSSPHQMPLGSVAPHRTAPHRRTALEAPSHGRTCVRCAPLGRQGGALRLS
jgi:hypothetical protein